MTWWMWIALGIALVIVAIGLFWLLTEGRDRRRWNKLMNQPGARAAFERQYGVSLSAGPPRDATVRPKPIEKQRFEFTNWREHDELMRMEKEISVLTGAPGAVWEGAVRELGSPRLIALLSDQNFTLACRAAAGLGLLRDKTAVPALVRFLEHEDWGVRNNAAMALGEIADASAVDGLTKAAIDRDETVARNAQKALARIREQSAIQM